MDQRRVYGCIWTLLPLLTGCFWPIVAYHVGSKRLIAVTDSCEALICPQTRLVINGLLQRISSFDQCSSLSINRGIANPQGYWCKNLICASLLFFLNTPDAKRQ
jgi:hypothetical protein